MKVGTDGVLLGAWAPVGEKTRDILDIGTGTGLIALMLAQRCPEARIDAVEIDACSAEEAKQNFLNSPWPGRLSVSNSSFQTFGTSSGRKYDLVVCNPPFFSKSLRNNDGRKATARHNHVLTQNELIAGVLNIISDKGSFCLILPVSDFSDFKLSAARKGLFEHKRLSVKPTPQKPVKRVLSCWSKYSSSQMKAKEMVLEIARHQYSEEFKALTDGFYLK